MGAHIHRVSMLFMGCFNLHVKIPEQALCATYLAAHKPRISFQYRSFYCWRHKHTQKHPFLANGLHCLEI